MDDQDFKTAQKSYELLNYVLTDAGVARHNEPLEIASDYIFEAQMWGYGGLHAIRRMAAYLAYENRLPPASEYDLYSSDPLTEKLHQAHLSYLHRVTNGFWRILFKKCKKLPKFQHLLLHSDCEGFYLPRDFEIVIFDHSPVPRESIGGMIGSAPRLLNECLEIATRINLPLDLDPEADAFWDYAEKPASDGEKWTMYGIEAFGLVRLIHACKLSIASGAALVFC